jgi:hypothetical protein
MKTTPESSDDISAPEDDDKSAMAIRELIRVLEAAVSSGVESVGVEWLGDELLAFHASEARAATKFAKPLQLDVIAEIVKRAQIGRKHKGTMRLPLLGHDYSVAVEEYDRFGEPAYTLTLTKRGKKRAE